MSLWVHAPGMNVPELAGPWQQLAGLPRARQGRHSPQAQKLKGIRTSLIEKNHLNRIFKKIKINKKIPNEQNTKGSSKDRLNIADFSFASGSWPARPVRAATWKLKMPTGHGVDKDIWGIPHCAKGHLPPRGANFMLSESVGHKGCTCLRGSLCTQDPAVKCSPLAGGGWGR